MQKSFFINFENGKHLTFYVNNHAGYFYGELAITNIDKNISNNQEIKIGDAFGFKDDTFEGFIEKIKSFIKKNFDLKFEIVEK